MKSLASCNNSTCTNLFETDLQFGNTKWNCCSLQCFNEHWKEWNCEDLPEKIEELEEQIEMLETESLEMIKDYKGEDK